MPHSPPQKGLYTLRFNQFRFAYELTDQSIIISTIIRFGLFQPQTNMLDNMFELASLMNHTLPNLIENLFTIRPTHSSKNLSEDKTELCITINIPTNISSNSDDSFNDESDSDLSDINAIHNKLLKKLNKKFDNFSIRWLGFLESTVEPPSQPPM